MFKKIEISENLSHNQLVGYKHNLSYHDRLKKANADDLRNNSIEIDWGNGYSTLLPKKSKKFQ